MGENHEMLPFDSIEGHHGSLGKRCPFEGKWEDKERIICPCSAVHLLETELNAAISISARAYDAVMNAYRSAHEEFVPSPMIFRFQAWVTSQPTVWNGAPDTSMTASMNSVSF